MNTIIIVYINLAGKLQYEERSSLEYAKERVVNLRLGGIKEIQMFGFTATASVQTHSL